MSDNIVCASVCIGPLKESCENYLNRMRSGGNTATFSIMEKRSDVVYERLRKQHHCIDLYNNSINSVLTNYIDIGVDRKTELLNSIQWVHSDLRTHPSVAALAWLGTQELNIMFDDPFIPEDLHYNLILKAYIPVLRMCNYLTGLGSYKEDKELFKNLWESPDYHKKLLEQTSKHLELSQEQVEQEVAPLLLPI